MADRAGYRDERPPYAVAGPKPSAERSPNRIDELTLRYIRAHVIPLRVDREETSEEAPDPDPGPR